ncbi:MAG TPA: SigE family RNA polymerase sigma factor [Streptosporangiaceae bacterium]|nr:SigE family RNA polymerase sigma factor [Streptosporangiaceae bacterium]
MTFDDFAAARLPAMLRFATALTGDADLAKDLVQEVLIRVSGRWPEIGQLDRPEAYVRKMVVNEYLSWRRRSWRLIPSGMSGHLTGPSAPDPAEGYADREALLAELVKLSRRQRTALVLRYYEGFSDAEIADVMGCTQSTVRGHVFRALAALRVELDEPLAAGTPGKETC